MGIMGVIAVWAAVSIGLEQRFKWASAVSGAIIALAGAMMFTNIGVLPVESPVYDTVWSYVVPLAIPLCCFRSMCGRFLRKAGVCCLFF